MTTGTTGLTISSLNGAGLEKRVDLAEQLPDGGIITSNGTLQQPKQEYPRIVENMTNEAYHAERDHVSSSSLKCFMQSIPEYHGRYVTGEIEHPKATAEMNLGTALHIMALEPQNWDKMVAVSPKCSTKNTNIWKDHVAANPGKLCIMPEDMEAVGRMLASIHRHPEAKALMTEPGREELTVFWQHSSGLRCKTRFDRLTDSGTIVDIKTANDPTPDGFSKAVRDRGYHYSATFYVSCGQEALNMSPDFRHVVVGNKEPYETVIYSLDAKWWYVAREAVARAIDELQECRALDSWQSRHSGVVTLDAPGWLR